MTNCKGKKWKQKLTSHLLCYSTVGIIAIRWLIAKLIELKWYQPHTRWFDDDTVWIEQSTRRKKKQKVIWHLPCSQRMIFFELNNWLKKENREKYLSHNVTTCSMLIELYKWWE